MSQRGGVQQTKRDAGNVQRAPCDVQRAICNVQRATCTVQRASSIVWRTTRGMSHGLPQLQDYNRPGRHGSGQSVAVMPPAAAGLSEPLDSCAQGVIIGHSPSALAGGLPCNEAVSKLQFCKATPSDWVVELAHTSSLACAIKEVVAWPVPVKAWACRSTRPTRHGPSGREDCHIIRYVRSKLLKPVLLAFPPAPPPRVRRRIG